MPVQPPATERSRRTRTELGQAVHDQVARTGTLDVARVAAAAGVSPATFYAHFDTHDDALAAALDLSLANVIGVSQRHFTIEQLLDRGVRPVVTSMVTDATTAFGGEALVMRAALARLPHHRGLREVYRRHEAAGRAHLTKHIKLAQRAGLFRPGDADHRATSLLVLTQGLNNPLLVASTDGERQEIVDDLVLAITAVLAVDDGA